MKNILFVLSLILWCSCNNDMLETIENDTEIMTRVTSSDGYYFGTSSNTPLADIVVNNEGVSHQSYYTILSYQETGDTFTDIAPQILNAPSWISIDCQHVYYKTYVIFVTVEANTSNERYGYVSLKQPGSNNTLSFGVVQDSYNNNAYITAEKLSLGRFKIKVSTQYPVKSGTVFFVYYSTFNGKDTGSAFTMLTVLPGESSAFTTIDHSKEEIYGNHFSITMTDAKCYPDTSVDKYHYVTNIDNSGLR